MIFKWLFSVPTRTLRFAGNLRGNRILRTWTVATRCNLTAKHFDNLRWLYWQILRCRIPSSSDMFMHICIDYYRIDKWLINWCCLFLEGVGLQQRRAKRRSLTDSGFVGIRTGVVSGMLGHIMYWKQTPSFKNRQVCVPTASLNSPVKWCDTCILLCMFILCQAFRHLKSFDMFQLDKWWRDWNVQSIIFHKTCWGGRSLLAQTILNEPNPKFVIYSII